MLVGVSYTLTFKGHALYVQFYFPCLLTPSATHMGSLELQLKRWAGDPVAPPAW